MTRSVGTERSYFESLYADAADPWRFETSWYEQRKYLLTVAALPNDRYRRAVEPGCANGVLSAMLADRCDELFSFDFIEGAVDRASVRLADRPHVHVFTASFPDYWPDGTGDLVVWSEVTYYLSDVGWESAVEGMERWLEPGGTLVSVHYTGETDYPLHGADIGRRLDTVDFLQRQVTLIDGEFDLGVWRRRAAE